MTTLRLRDAGFLGSAPSSQLNAASYIAAVEAADGQPLEEGVKNAITAFFDGCISDGIADALKTCCILMGARTLAGALVPVVGPNPTNINFVAADYNRKTGLLGNGSSKYLNTNTAHNATPQNSVHLAVYTQNNVILSDGSSPLRFYAGAASGSVTSIGGGSGNPNTWVAHDTGSSVPIFQNQGNIGLFGVSRSNSSNYNRRIASITTNVSRAASATPPGTGSVTVFARSGAFFAPCRLAFYSFGNFLDLAALDSRVTTLINDIAAAIP